MLYINGNDLPANEVPQYIQLSNGDYVWTVNAKDANGKTREWHTPIYLSQNFDRQLKTYDEATGSYVYNSLTSNLFASTYKMFNNVSNNYNLTELECRPGFPNLYIDLDNSNYFFSNISSNTGICPNGILFRFYNHSHFFESINIRKLSEQWTRAESWNDNNWSYCFSNANMRGDAGDVYIAGVNVQNAAYMFHNAKLHDLIISNTTRIVNADGMFANVNFQNWDYVPGLYYFCRNIFTNSIINTASMFENADLRIFTDYSGREPDYSNFSEPSKYVYKNTMQMFRNAKIEPSESYFMRFNYLNSSTAASHTGMFVDAQIYRLSLSGNLAGGCASMFRNALIQATYSGMLNITNACTSVAYAFDNCSHGMDLYFNLERACLSSAAYMFNNAKVSIRLTSPYVTFNNAAYFMYKETYGRFSSGEVRGSTGNEYEGLIFRTNNLSNAFNSCYNYKACTNNEGNYLYNVVYLYANNYNYVTNTFKDCPMHLKYVGNMFIYINTLSPSQDASNMLNYYLNKVCGATVTRSGQWFNFTMNYNTTVVQFNTYYNLTTKNWTVNSNNTSIAGVNHNICLIANRTQDSWLETLASGHLNNFKVSYSAVVIQTRVNGFTPNGIQR